MGNMLKLMVTFSPDFIAMVIGLDITIIEKLDGLHKQQANLLYQAYRRGITGVACMMEKLECVMGSNLELAEALGPIFFALINTVRKGDIGRREANKMVMEWSKKLRMKRSWFYLPKVRVCRCGDEEWSA